MLIALTHRTLRVMCVTLCPLVAGCQVTDETKQQRINQALDSRLQEWIACAKLYRETERLVEGLQGFPLLQLGADGERFDQLRKSLQRAAERTCACTASWRDAVRSELALQSYLRSDLPTPGKIDYQTLGWKTVNQWEETNSKVLGGEPSSEPRLYPLERQEASDRAAADQAWANRTPISTRIWLGYRMDTCY